MEKGKRLERHGAAFAYWRDHLAERPAARASEEAEPRRAGRPPDLLRLGQSAEGERLDDPVGHEIAAHALDLIRVSPQALRDVPGV
jgi:hypothetical protein